jgi:hypothetical protein
MEEKEKLDLINSNSNDVKVEQVVQNYLIEPDVFTSNSERAVASLGESNLPENELLNQSLNTPFDFGNDLKLFERPRSTTSTTVDTDTTNRLLQQIPFFETYVPKTVTPANILEKPNEPNFVTKKEFTGVISEINGTVNPALQNLYKSVSALMDKGKDPKGFTETRPTYNGDLHYFGDELTRTSQKFTWS